MPSLALPFATATSPEQAVSIPADDYRGLTQRVYGHGDRMAEEQGADPRRLTPVAFIPGHRTATLWPKLAGQITD